jgi:hypothetical protein
MKHFLVSLALLTALNTTWASLGDNGDRIESLYGDIVQRQLRDDETVAVVYHKDRDRYLYLVVFASNRSILERYSHANGTGLSEKEIARFLKANAGGATWAPDNKPTERKFERSDHGAEATYGDVNGRMTLTVRERTKRATPNAQRPRSNDQ